jgi:hypothetical protein
VARNNRALNWDEIQRFHDAGNDRNACAKRFGFGIAAWYKAAERGDLRTVLRANRIDWAAVQKYYDEGHTYRECVAKFKFSSSAWCKAAQRKAISSRPQLWPIERMLAESKSRCAIKSRLLGAGLLANRCDECGITDWRGSPLSMQLHHRNGLGKDHRLENLAMLCPNCHSQTPTFAARNKKQNGRR